MAALAQQDLVGRRLYLDANVFIYFLDGDNPFFQSAAKLLNAAAEEIFSAVTGDAAVAEVMVGAYRAGNPYAISRFRNFFNKEGFVECRPHDSTCFDTAAMLRGTTGVPLIDALHLATAKQSGCDGLVTGDLRMKPALGLPIVNLRAL